MGLFVGHCLVLHGEVLSYLWLLPICWWLTADSPGSECDRLSAAGADSQSEYEVLAAWRPNGCVMPRSGRYCLDCRDCPLSGHHYEPHCAAAALGFNSDCLYTRCSILQYWGQRTCHVPGGGHVL